MIKNVTVQQKIFTILNFKAMHKLRNMKWAHDQMQFSLIREIMILGLQIVDRAVLYFNR